MTQSREDAVALSRGGIWTWEIPADPGVPWPNAVATNTRFMNTAGAVIADITGTVTPTSIKFLALPAVVDGIPAGSKFETFIQLPEGPLQIRYGIVLRREAQFFNLPPNANVLRKFEDTLQRTALGWRWEAVLGGTKIYNNSAQSLAYGVGPNVGLFSNSPSAIRFYQQLVGDTAKVTVTLVKAGINEVQTVTIGGAPTGGVFTLTFNGQTTTPIARNATAATVQSALQALSTIGANNAVVSGNAGGPYTVTFQGTLGTTDVAQMTSTTVNEVQTATIAGAPTGGTFALAFGGQTTTGIAFNAAASAVQSALVALSTIGAGNVAVTGGVGGPYTITFQGALAAQDVAQITSTTVNEIQTVTVTGAPTGGTFTLTFNGQTTSAIAWNATAATVQTALQALSTIGAGNAVVAGSAGGPYTVTFQGTLAGTNVVPMTASGALLTGGTTPGVTIATTTDGVGFTGGTTPSVTMATQTQGVGLTGGTTPGVTIATTATGVPPNNQGKTGVVLCADQLFTSGLVVQFDTVTNEIHFGKLTAPATVVYQGAAIANTIANNDSYTAAYNNLTDTLSVFKGSSATALGSWVDTLKTVPHGNGYRYMGLNFIPTVLQTGPQVSGWAGKDDV